MPASHVFKMVRVKKVRVNGKRGQPDQHLAKDDVITIRGDDTQLLGGSVKTEAPKPVVDLNDLKILLEDEWVLVIDKPSGMAHRKWNHGRHRGRSRARIPGAHRGEKRVCAVTCAPHRSRNLGHLDRRQASPCDGALH